MIRKRITEFKMFPTWRTLFTIKGRPNNKTAFLFFCCAFDENFQKKEKEKSLECICTRRGWHAPRVDHLIHLNNECAVENDCEEVKVLVCVCVCFLSRCAHLISGLASWRLWRHEMISFSRLRISFLTSLVNVRSHQA